MNSKLTEEEGRVASFLSSIFKEVLCKLPGSVSDLVQTVLPGANIPPAQVSAREQHTPLWGQPSGGVDPGQTLLRVRWLPGVASQRVSKALFQVRQLVPLISLPKLDYYPRQVLLAQLLSIPIVHKQHRLIITVFSPAPSTALT